MSEPPALLRLGCSPGSLRRIRRHPLLAAAGARRAAIARPDLTLEDTPGRDFAAAGWLCLGRRDAGMQRQETLPVAGQALTAAPPLGAAMLPLAEGHAEIASLALAGGLQLQAVQMTLTGAGRTAAAAELVLAAPGDPAPEGMARLLALALALAEELPLYWTGAAAPVLMAADLGLAEPPPLRSGSLPFDLGDRAAAIDAFTAIARHCLQQFDCNMQPVLRDRDIEGVHQMRVALRRLRSAFNLFRPVLPAALVAPLIDELRWLNEPLGRKRDLDVFLAETLAPLAARLPDPRGLRHLRTVLEDRRAAAQAALESALRSSRALRLRLGLEAMLLRLPAEIAASGDAALQAAAAMPARRFAARLLEKRARKVKKLGRHHDTLEAEALHRLRIQCKKLRYAVEFFRPLHGRRAVRRFHAALAELQDCLGVLNDAAVGGALMRDVLGPPGGDPAAAAVAGWFIGRQEMQLAHLGEAWDAYSRAKPFWKADLND
ncbi:CHAD domain-containing protein [Ferrovibrio sp.]|uniref:CHAD domain-containing protein n=3 Tax=Ferrovibrio sp. TaxID=1917215 RepID=UPI00351257DD